jgi:hypothetical protein
VEVSHAREPWKIGVANATGGRLAHKPLIGMIYLLCLVSQVLGDLYLSRYFLSKLNYTKLLDCARQVICRRNQVKKIT